MKEQPELNAEGAAVLPTEWDDGERICQCIDAFIMDAEARISKLLTAHIGMPAWACEPTSGGVRDQPRGALLQCAAIRPGVRNLAVDGTHAL